jgi:large subunit ribosomal protein L17
MRHQKRGRKLNRTASHRKAMMSNLASALILNKRIQTTDAKSKELRGFVERLVTYAKLGDLCGRRLIQKRIQGKRSKQIANILIHDIAPSYENRNGGYTRIIKLNNRNNDNAPVSLIEFVDISSTVIDIETESEKEKGESKE